MKTFFLILILLISTNCKSQNKEIEPPLNVLFIGNSLTYFHNMPHVVQEMLKETNPNIHIEQSTFAGMSLSDHLTDIITSKTENSIRTRKKEDGEKTETEKKITEKSWDIIILQTGPVSVLIRENRDLKENKAIANIKKQVSSPTCKFILFYTWASKDTYPKQYCYPSEFIDKSIEKEECCSPIFENLEQEVTEINNSYDLVARENNLIKSDNGIKFYEIMTKFPQIELYEDDMHPNKYGAFLNACIFYQMLTNKKASDLNYNGNIEYERAKLLKKIAE